MHTFMHVHIRLYRTSAYLNISVFIATFVEYTTALIDHLLAYKTKHWDPYALPPTTPSTATTAATTTPGLLTDRYFLTHVVW